MIDQGMIELAKSEWASPVVLAPKSEGSLRLFIDYSRLNELTLKDSYPQLRIDGFEYPGTHTQLRSFLDFETSISGSSPVLQGFQNRSTDF